MFKKKVFNLIFNFNLKLLNAQKTKYQAIKNFKNLFEINI